MQTEILQLGRLENQARRLFGINLNAEQLSQMQIYARELLEWNSDRANLTAITEPKEIETRHFLDALSIMILDVPINAIVADVGTGGGFPGLVMKIVRPDIHLTLVESVGKKTEFLSHMAERLGLANVRVLKARAEDIGQDANYREQFDMAVARSVAYMPVLMEYLLPLCRVRGRCVAMKGPSALRELSEARTAIETFGGRFATMRSVSLPGVDQTHILVGIAKIRPTPSAFPRRAGVPTKRPILFEE